jgi:lipoate-protein ligase A
MKFRLIKVHEHDAFMNMALDEAIFEAVRDNQSPPTIRFFKWKPTAISIGYFQGIQNEINLELCKELGIDVVRRMTGGGAVVHENEITYSIIAPESFFPKDVIQSYNVICNCLVDALKELSIEAQFTPINDVTVNGMKISGSAQTRKSGMLWQHGTLLYKTNPEKIFSLLKGRVEKNKLTQSQKKIITCIAEHADVTEHDVVKALENAFSKDREIVHGHYTVDELERAAILAKTKYGTHEWNWMR